MEKHAVAAMHIERATARIADGKLGNAFKRSVDILVLGSGFLEVARNLLFRPVDRETWVSGLGLRE
jgi:hypothetical protein